MHPVQPSLFGCVEGPTRSCSPLLLAAHEASSDLNLRNSEGPLKPFLYLVGDRLQGPICGARLASTERGFLSAYFYALRRIAITEHAPGATLVEFERPHHALHPWLDLVVLGLRPLALRSYLLLCLLAGNENNWMRMASGNTYS